MLTLAERGEADKHYVKKLAKGVRYVFHRQLISRGPVNCHFVIMDLNRMDLVVKPVIAHNQIGRLERVSGMARRTGALAAINATFFRNSHPRLPIGFVVVDGRMLNRTQLSRTAMGISRGRRIFFGIPRIKSQVMVVNTLKRFDVHGLNRPRKAGEVIVYTSEYGERTRTNFYGKEAVVVDDRVVGIVSHNARIPRYGYVISFQGWTSQWANLIPLGTEVDFLTLLKGDFEEAEQMVTGGPRLLQNGHVVVSESIRREGFRGGLLPPNSRSAVGLLRSGELVFMMVERSSWRHSVGATYGELARLLKQAGATDAMGLDGGGAATLYVKGKGVVNYPQDGYERLVSTALTLKEE